MSRKNLLIAMVSFLFCVLSVFGQGIPRTPTPPSSIARTLRGMTIVIGNWWADYDVDTYVPRSDYDERQLEFRRNLLRENGFTMRTRHIAGWNEMPQIAATSIMAGRPAASVFLLQPDWAVSLMRQSLLFPVSTSRAINLNSTTPVEWNRTVTQAFTYDRRVYAFANGYNESLHASVLFWNKRLFREAGLDPDLPYDLQKSNEWTWDRFLEIAKQLTRDINNDGVIDVYAMPRDLSTEMLDAFVSSNGAMYVDKDRNGNLVNASGRPEFIEAVQFFIRLKNEGVMMDRPEGSNWDWFKPAFINGQVAMLIDQQYYATNDLMNMTDEWGMVLPPRGPRARNYVVFNDENVLVIPASTPRDRVDAILWAIQYWNMPLDDDWRTPQYTTYRSRRSVDETMALIRDQRLWQWKYHLHVPGFNRGGIAWEIWHHDGEPAQLVEAVRLMWNALIEDANGM